MSKETTVTETGIKSKAARPARKSLTNSGKMKVPHIPGFYTRFINTDDAEHAMRLQDCKDAWYEPVLRKELYGADCERPNDVVTVNDPSRPMLVKLPMDLRIEDEAAKLQRTNEAVDQAKSLKLQNEYGQVSVSHTTN